MTLVVHTGETAIEKIKKMVRDSGEEPHFFSNFEKAKNIIAIENENLEDMNHIITSFLSKYVQEKEKKKLLELKHSRNILIQTNLLTQIHSTGQFKKWQKPVVDACPKCNGTGQLYYFNRITKEVICNRCLKGQVWIDCPKCKGKGRVIIRFKKGGGTDSICTQCKESTQIYREKFKEPNSRFKVELTCRVCRGTTIAKILVLDYSLKSTTVCPLCDSLGIIIPKLKKKPKTNPRRTVLANPVIAGDLAVKINLLIDERKTFNSNKELDENRDEKSDL